jgi:uncharacterized membrane protein YeaQ/YmgE (transglycosylase-associated protein family)
VTADEPDDDEPKTSIIRRQPSGGFSEWRPPPPRSAVVEEHEPTTTGATAMAAATFNIVNGWATAVISTDLITGWWKTDRLFCVGVGFLTAVCGASIIIGAFQLLLRRRAGIYLTLVGATLAVLIFAGIFVTGARVAGLVHALPVLPAAAALFVVLPPTWRWTRRG